MPDQSTDGRLSITVTEHAKCAVVTMSGVLCLETTPSITSTVSKLLIDPGSVVLDLSRLRLEWAAGVGIFSQLLAAAGGWPAARLVLFGADEEMAAVLRRSGIPAAVPLVADLNAALRRVHQRPDWVRRYLKLSPEPAAVRLARTMVRRACADWDVNDEPADAAVMVADELVSNAVQHAGTPSRLTVELAADRGLCVRVRDYQPSASPRAHPVDPRRPSGHGLHLVSMLASRWAVTRHADGKTVWALIPVEHQ